jgi:hypothetical protein
VYEKVLDPKAFLRTLTAVWHTELPLSKLKISKCNSVPTGKSVVPVTFSSDEPLIENDESVWKSFIGSIMIEFLTGAGGMISLPK